MISLRRFLLCCGIALLGASAWGDEIRNWSAPPYWSGPVRVRAPEELRDGVGTEEVEAAEVLPTSAVPFVAIVPCRIVDTRGNGFTGAYGPPALAGGATARVFNVPAGPCPGIPADAAAFSINIGAILPAADGFLTAYPTGGAQPTVSNVNFLANEVIANSAVIGAGTNASISVFVNVTTHLIIDINGYYAGSAVTTLNGLSGNVNLAVGSNVTITPSGQTLTIASTGGLPTGSAGETLRHNGSAWVANSVLTSDGTDVTVTGILKLPPVAQVFAGASRFLHNAGGSNNTFLGVNAGSAATGITANTGVGYNALYHAGGLSGGNVAVGAGALFDTTTGLNNTAIGQIALENITSGSSNIAIGANVGTSISTGSNNLYIGSPNAGNESGQIRIGNNAVHTQGTVITSIYGFGSGSGIPVIVNAGGRLGTTTSSVRVKEDVRDIGAESEGLMSLRPVAFKYKASHEPGGLTQYGLLAEEMAEVYPELVVYDDEGRPQAIRSQLLDPLLLNEIQKQRREIEDLKARLEKLEGKNAP
jgi:hypothetical protein